MAPLYTIITRYPCRGEACFNPDTAYVDYFNQFTYTYTDSNGCSNSTNEYVVAEICNDVPVIRPDALLFTIYPNPASDLLNIKAEGLT